MIAVPSRRTRGLAWLLLLVSPGTLVCQRTIIVADRVSCPSCRIDLSNRVTLTAPREGFPGFPADFSRDSQGRIYLGFSSPAEILRFSRSGVMERRWVRSGEGPGEMRMLRYLPVVAGDSLLTFDPSLQRANLYDPSGVFVRTFRIPGGMSPPIQLGNGSFVLNERIGEASRIGFPHHEFSANGVMGRSFGPRMLDIKPTEGFWLSWFSAPSSRRPVGATFWSAPAFGAYVVELREIGVSQPVLTINREAPWFPPPAEMAVVPPSLNRPPPTRIWGVWEDAEGLLWVLVRVPDPRWRSAITGGASSEGVEGRRGAPTSLRITDPSRYTDFRFDVIDPVRGVLLASQQFDEGFSIGSSPGVLIGSAPGSDPDDPTWAIVLPRLTGVLPR